MVYYRINRFNNPSLPFKGGYLIDGSNQTGVLIIAFQ